ncbi:MAG: DUF1707 domain-containing protein [Acidimicrobiales bacterium]|nr:DUF1707 domain-containing protein [Acidimicrobiales bacterium]
MRVSDTDRQRAIDELRRHCAAGRINVDEYAARIEKALAATTLEELDLLRADLPMIRIADPGGRGARIWARANGSSGALVPRSPGGAWALGQTISATLIALVSVVVVVSAVVIALVADWAWAVVLLAGWVAGIVQGRLGRRAR